ncbi:MAG: RdgB/HAM1 family non-canonical purine NTP pyrophosphatase [Actinomycetota bacterium]|nr:RdgB/HAM1 family non-canonical purine NTP pyrophosphatase [Actinomycetota bacterium]MDP2287226.1 RdgB/HAM1 family non-canonical purine NTP pyrophosphatase [Actinomycetota bacterium]
MSVRLVLASRNSHKIIEMRRILTELGLDIELVGTDEFPDLPDVEETGSSFAANAILKAREVCEYTGLPAIGDDSGLSVDALNGMPGIYSARWAGTHGRDQDNLKLLIAQLDHVPAGRRGAAFHCAVAVATPEGDERIVEGVVEGSLIGEPRGANGFGYDPIFVPTGFEITTAEMSDGDKDSISHRGRALRAIAPVLAELFPAALRR